MSSQKRRPGDPSLGTKMREIRTRKMRELEQDRKPTQEGIAREMQINPGTLQKFEDGREMPWPHDLNTWADLLKLTKSEWAEVFRLYYDANFTMRWPSQKELTEVDLHDLRKRFWKFQKNWGKNSEVYDYVRGEFPAHLLEAVRNTFGEKFITKKEGMECVNVEKVLNDLSKDPNLRKRFQQQLSKQWASTIMGKVKIGGEEASALKAVTKALLDLDQIAVPFPLYIKELLNQGLEAYTRVLTEVARSTIPFVAIEKKLRGLKVYKKEYLHLLDEMGILSDLEKYFGTSLRTLEGV